MLFFEVETPDGWGIPGVHGNWADDEIDGNVQGSVFLIKSEGEALLFDTGNRAPGTPNSMTPRLIENIERDGVKLRYIFISHFHYDHVGAAEELRERYGAKVLCHPLERPIVEDPLFVTTRPNVTRFGLTPAELLEDFNLGPGETLALSDPLIIEKYWSFPVTVDAEVAGGDILEVGSLRLEVIDIPGHSPGQIGLWNPATRSFYSGDLSNFPSPLGPYPIGDAQKHRDSIERVRALRPKYFWEGHFFGTYDEDSTRRRLDHIMQQQDDISDRIVAVLARSQRPQTILELLPEIFPIKLDAMYPVPTGTTHRQAYAEACIQTNLRRLVTLGEAQRIKDGNCVRWAAAVPSERTRNGRAPHELAPSLRSSK